MLCYNMLYYRQFWVISAQVITGLFRAEALLHTESVGSMVDAVQHARSHEIRCGLGTVKRQFAGDDKSLSKFSTYTCADHKRGKINMM